MVSDTGVASLTLEIDGLGIIVYAPSSASHIGEGEDYFTPHYMGEDEVQRHIQEGSIVAFATSSPGTYHLTVRAGYPPQEELAAADFKLRLAVRSDGRLVFRDLFDLMEWTAEYPAEHSLAVPEGIYHVTLMSDRPASGVLGDDQQIAVYLQPLEQFPELARQGIPTLCT